MRLTVSKACMKLTVSKRRAGDCLFGKGVQVTDCSKRRQDTSVLHKVCIRVTQDDIRILNPSTLASFHCPPFLKDS